jgi:hypothetical protein
MVQCLVRKVAGSMPPQCRLNLGHYGPAHHCLGPINPMSLTVSSTFVGLEAESSHLIVAYLLDCEASEASAAAAHACPHALHMLRLGI